MMNYRTRIYEDYASDFQDTLPNFDAAAAERWGKAYDYYLRGWLPESKDAEIVDLGCGGGKLMQHLKLRGYSRLAGVDISPDQVKLARQVITEVYEESVLDFLAVRPGTFDCMTGLDIIEHFYKDEVLRFLDLCYAGLRPGGRLILQTPNAESPLGTVCRYGDFTHEVCFNPNALLRLLSLCGFKGLEAREQGPVPWGYGMVSTLRYAIWLGIRTTLKIWNLAETGSGGGGVFNRVFLVSGSKLA